MNGNNPNTATNNVAAQQAQNQQQAAQNAAANNAAAPAFDYEKLASIVAGKQAVTENTVVKLYLSQQGRTASLKQLQCLQIKALALITEG